MTPTKSRRWTAWLLPLAVGLAGCGSDILAPNEVVDTTAPSVPVGLGLAASDGILAVTWTPNAEADLAGYVVTRSLDDGVTWTIATTTLLTECEFEEAAPSKVQYRVAAVDVASNQSGFSSSVGYLRPTDRPKFPEDTAGPR